MSPPLYPLSACQICAFASVYAFPPQLMRTAVWVCAAAETQPITNNPSAMQIRFTLPPRSVAFLLSFLLHAKRGWANTEGGPLALPRSLYGSTSTRTTVLQAENRTLAGTTQPLYEWLPQWGTLLFQSVFEICEKHISKTAPNLEEEALLPRRQRQRL